MKKSFLWVSILCITALVSIAVSAETVTTKGAMAAANAADKNIRNNSVANSMNHPVARPAKSRGLNGTCDIHVANNTGFYVEFYFNGQLAGAMGPWGALNPNITEGNAALYARAVFTDGSSLTFGPRTLTCTGSDYTW